MKARVWLGLSGAVALVAGVLIVVHLAGRGEYTEAATPDRDGRAEPVGPSQLSEPQEVGSRGSVEPPHESEGEGPQTSEAGELGQVGQQQILGV